MKISVEALTGGAQKIALDGDLDSKGVNLIGPQLAAITDTADAVVIDLADVRFLSSSGIRLLLVHARSVTLRGGKLVLAEPQAMVEKVITTCGIDRLIPVCASVSEAETRLAT